ncbi:hypothetical protein [Streptomyces sp. OR43]|uniref:hypothetical protein n=1 Tax=Streptomyces sp. or43 TaxID=2478957 RepID=UPI0011CE4353|nr:hypothetical protein [Streptomyces sp. or43]TXS35050.1 hypothetical protein EAO72_40085 [Streptomyces sp. or43]
MPGGPARSSVRRQEPADEQPAQLKAALNNFLTTDVIRLKGGKTETVVRSEKGIRTAKALIQAIDDAQMGQYKEYKNYPGSRNADDP